MAKESGLGLGALCEALGVDRPDEVTRIVVDVRAGDVPMLYVERIGDAQKIVAALREPGIEVRREMKSPVCECGHHHARHTGQNHARPMLHCIDCACDKSTVDS